MREHPRATNPSDKGVTCHLSPLAKCGGLCEHKPLTFGLRYDLVLLGGSRCYIVYNITATSCCRQHLLATVSRWDEVPPPRPLEESLSSGGVHAVCSVEANTPSTKTNTTELLGEALQLKSPPLKRGKHKRAGGRGNETRTWRRSVGSARAEPGGRQ